MLVNAVPGDAVLEYVAFAVAAIVVFQTPAVAQFELPEAREDGLEYPSREVSVPLAAVVAFQTPLDDKLGLLGNREDSLKLPPLDVAFTLVDGALSVSVVLAIADVELTTIPCEEELVVPGSVSQSHP